MRFRSIPREKQYLAKCAEFVSTVFPFSTSSLELHTALVHWSSSLTISLTYPMIRHPAVRTIGDGFVVGSGSGELAKL